MMGRALHNFVAVAAVALFICLAPSVDAHDLPGTDAPKFREALASWLDDDDAPATTFYSLALEGNVASAAMFLYLTNKFRPQAPLRDVPGFGALGEEADQTISSVRAEVLRGLPAMDDLSRSMMILIQGPGSGTERRFDARIAVLEAGLDDLAFATMRDVSLDQAERLLALRPMSKLPARRQSEIYFAALQNPGHPLSESVVDDGVDAVNNADERAYEFQFAYFLSRHEGHPVPALELDEDRTTFLALSFKAGYELTNRVGLRDDDVFEAFLASFGPEFDDWVIASERTAHLRPLCSAACGNPAPKCVRAAYGASHGAPHSTLERVRPPDGIEDRETFLSSPRGLRVLSEVMARSSFVEPQPDDAGAGELRYFRAFSELSPCLAAWFQKRMAR